MVPSVVRRPQEPYADSYRRLQAKLLERYGLIAQSRFLHLEKLSTRIHVLEAGAGEPVVFLHGGGGIAAEHVPVAARLPTSFLWGERDAFMMPEEGRAAAQLVPARFDVISDAGHMPSTDQPEATATLLDFELGSYRVYSE